MAAENSDSTATLLDRNVLLSTPVEQFDLSVRTANVFKNAGIRYLGDLLGWTEASLLTLPNCGTKTIKEIRHVLGGLQLALGTPQEGWIPVETPTDLDIPRAAVNIGELDEGVRARLFLRVKELNLSVRATNILMHGGFEFVGDFVGYTSSDLLRFQHCGRTTVDELARKCAELGVPLGTKLLGWDRDSAREVRAAADEQLEQHIDEARNAVLRLPAATCLEDELSGLVRNFSNDRNTEIVLKLFGWTGRGKQTLEAVGQEYGLTRERVRQLSERVSRQVRECNVELPWLQQAVSAVRETCPAPASILTSLLPNRGISKVDFDPSGLVTACEELGIEFGARSILVGTTRVYVLSECINVPKELFRLCRRLTSSQGCANFDAMCDELSIPDDLRNRYRDILVLAHRTQWLDKDRQWLFSGSMSRNRIVNLVSKVLFISPTIGLHELRRAIGRSRRLEIVPPSAVLANFVQATGLATFQDGFVIAEQAFENAIEPDSVEAKMIAVFKDHGPVLGWDRLQELCIAAGVNPTSAGIYMSISPAISRLARGVYALVGAKVEPGMVEEELAKLAGARRTADFGWSKRGTLWCALYLNRNLLTSGSASLPPFVAGMVADREWQAQFGGKALNAVLKCKNHFIWSLSKSLAHAGAEPGDICILEFDLKSNTVEISVGSEELADAWETGRIDLLNSAQREPNELSQ